MQLDIREREIHSTDGSKVGEPKQGQVAPPREANIPRTRNIAKYFIILQHYNISKVGNQIEDEWPCVAWGGAGNPTVRPSQPPSPPPLCRRRVGLLSGGSRKPGCGARYRAEGWFTV
jgi:hypothetical protein